MTTGVLTGNANSRTWKSGTVEQDYPSSLPGLSRANRMPSAEKLAGRLQRLF